jgi:sporulation protein YlmC with PRC-barrel domain
MYSAKDLRGRTVLDVDQGRNLGQVDELLLDFDGQQIAGLVVTTGRSLLDPGEPIHIKGSAIHAIGPDAVTVRHSADDTPSVALEAFPHLDYVLGKTVVSQAGTVVGSVRDVLLAPDGGRIVGYELSASGRSEGLDVGIGRALFGSKRERNTDYVRADLDIRVGADALVVADEAIVRGARDLGGGVASSPESANSGPRRLRDGEPSR